MSLSIHPPKRQSRKIVRTDRKPILIGRHDCSYENESDRIRSPDSSRLNKGTAFSDSERDAFGLHGLLPPHVGTLEDQRRRRKKGLDELDTPIQKYSFMRDLQDINETLFYSLITHYIEETLPIVYTPTVGEACQQFSEIWRKPRGLFLSYPTKA